MHKFYSRLWYRYDEQAVERTFKTKNEPSWPVPLRLNIGQVFGIVGMRPTIWPDASRATPRPEVSPAAWGFSNIGISNMSRASAS